MNRKAEAASTIYLGCQYTLNSVHTSPANDVNISNHIIQPMVSYSIILFAICKVSAMDDAVWNIYKYLYTKLAINAYINTQASNSESQSGFAQFYQVFFVIVKMFHFFLYISTLFITFEQHSVSATQTKRPIQPFSKEL